MSSPLWAHHQTSLTLILLNWRYSNEYHESFSTCHRHLGNFTVHFRTSKLEPLLPRNDAKFSHVLLYSSPWSPELAISTEYCNWGSVSVPLTISLTASWERNCHEEYDISSFIVVIVIVDVVTARLTSEAASLSHAVQAQISAIQAR